MLAESLGAEVVGLAGERAGEALLDLARERNVTRIVVGKPTHARWRDLVYGSLLDDLVRGSGDIDVHVISGEEAEQTAGGLPPAGAAPRPLDARPYVRGLVPIALATLTGALLRTHVDLADVSMIYLVAIAATATFLGRGPSVLASVVAVAAFNFFFVPPFYTFAVGDFRHLLTFLVMLCAGVLISSLADRIRRQSAAARHRERRTAALFALTRALAGARDAGAIGAVAAQQIRDVFESAAVLLVADPQAPSGLAAPAATELELTDVDRTVARWALEHDKPAGHGLDTLHGARVIALPLLAGGHAVGVVVLEPQPEGRFGDPEQRHLLDAFVSQIALALERAQIADDAQRAELRAETEEMRSSLLSSVSHDLRTPIATILGTSTTLLDPDAELAPPDRAELITMVRDEAGRLARLVSNLLDMTRVESGALEPKKEWVPLEEVIGSAMSRMGDRLDGRPVTIDVPEDAMAPMDPVLFEQVLINLLENAVKHTPERTALAVRAGTRADAAWIEVADRGPGVPPGQEARIFEKFVRATDRPGGVGLGLPICRGIVQAHGGTITASNAPEGGAVFRVVLPREGEPPPLPAEAESGIEASP
jgi:two-component system sensor histidine kinase KdpD